MIGFTGMEQMMFLRVVRVMILSMGRRTRCIIKIASDFEVNFLENKFSA